MMRFHQFCMSGGILCVYVTCDFTKLGHEILKFNAPDIKRVPFLPPASQHCWKIRHLAFHNFIITISSHRFICNVVSRHHSALRIKSERRNEGKEKNIIIKMEWIREFYGERVKRRRGRRKFSERRKKSLSMNKASTMKLVLSHSREVKLPLVFFFFSSLTRSYNIYKLNS